MAIRDILSRHTRLALAAETEDYVSKDTDEYELIKGLKRDNGLEKVYRFDIGKNSDGYSDLVAGVLEEADLAELCRQNLADYPDNHYLLLRRRLADLHNLNPEWFVLSAGLESMIDHVSRVFLQGGDAFLIAVPNFSVFADFSIRAGGRPIYLPLKPEENFQWTAGTVTTLKELISTHAPKLLWISNPVNPTGQSLPLVWLEELATACALQGTAIVVDEAYGEYTDTDQKVVSASGLTQKCGNLMVLRTFSKIHALPSLRVGYLMCSDGDILQAISLYRPMFPFSWFSLFLAGTASIDEEHVQEARRKLSLRYERLCRQLETLNTFSCLPSQTNTLMLRNLQLSADELWQALAKRGFLTANLNRVNGLKGQNFLRMTICSEAENDLFISACREVELELK
ncbi:MAG: histidinol-phosphate transaminase [Pseudomonadota bacterium]|nr:histidinol-phosphate transaminase [Pseudomonadota bacterium]